MNPTLEQAARQALEALRDLVSDSGKYDECDIPAIARLEQALKQQAEGEPLEDLPQPNAAVAAIEYALHQGQEGLSFLDCWMHGDFDVIRKEWPDAPATVFQGADPMNQINRKHDEL